jgi:hypothetical protein
MEFSTSKLDFEKCTVKAQVWDTAGQERFESMSRHFYKDALGAALVYDVASRQSFLHVQNVWLPQIRLYANENIKIVLGESLCRSLTLSPFLCRTEYGVLCCPSVIVCVLCVGQWATNWICWTATALAK